MPRALSEIIQAAEGVLQELYDYTVTADQIRAALKRDCEGWSEADIDDVVMLAQHVAFCEANAINEAVGTWAAMTRATAQALSKYRQRAEVKVERRRRREFVDQIVSGPAGPEEPRRSAEASR